MSRPSVMKPCAHCGGPPVLWIRIDPVVAANPELQSGGDDDNQACVFCHECGAQCGWVDTCDDIDICSRDDLAIFAIGRWNARDDRHSSLYSEEQARVDKALANEGVTE